jgi:putative hydrolase of the HAD superfamily
MAHEIPKLPELLITKQPTLLIDIGNVLTHSNHQITIDWLHENKSITKEKAATFFSNEAYADFTRGLINQEQFLDKIRTSLGLPDLTIDEAKMAHNAHIYEVDQPMVELVINLKNKGYNIVLVTDTNPWQTNHQESMLLSAGLSKIHIIRSHDLGKIKSDPPKISAEGKPISFFSKALNQLGILPGNTLFVDDNELNIAIARRSGIPSIHFVGQSELEYSIFNNQKVG